MPTKTASTTETETGCTDNNACRTEDGPCSWVNEEHTLCSNPECVAKMMEVTA